MTQVFERVDLRFSDWETILNQFEDTTVFQTPAWLAFVIKTQRAEPVFAALKQGRQTLGYFSGLIIKRFGLKVLGSPLPGWTTSYMGITLPPEGSRLTAIRALCRFAFNDLGCAHFEMMDRKLSLEDVKRLGITHRAFSGYEVNLTNRLEELYANMTSACRRCIRRAEKTGVTIEEASDPQFAEEYFAQLQEVFRRQSLVPPYGIERVRELIRYVFPTRQLLLLRARDKKGKCIATGIFPAMNGTMYFWGGASWREYQMYRPNEAIHWYAMKYWKARGMRRYDLGGGGQYKRKFGGHEIAVPWIRMSKYPGLEGLRSVARRMVDWRQQLLGNIALGR